MKMIKQLLVVLILSHPVSVPGAEILSSRADAKALTESVMSEMSKGSMKDGLAKLRPYTVVNLAEFDAQMAHLDLQLPAMAQRFGKPLGFELVSEDEVGESLVRYVYLQKFERHVTIWRFIFYKPDEKWLLNTWYFDDQVQAIF